MGRSREGQLSQMFLVFMTLTVSRGSGQLDKNNEQR